MESSFLPGSWAPSVGLLAPYGLGAPPTMNGAAGDVPTFRASTSELDRYRLLFLVAGVAIGLVIAKSR